MTRWPRTRPLPRAGRAGSGAEPRCAPTASPTSRSSTSTSTSTRRSALGLAPADINDTLSTALGSSYVNDFINKGRVKKVYMQADAPYRMQPGDIDNWHVRNRSGEMVPLSAIATGSWTRRPAAAGALQRQLGLGLSGEPGARVVSSGDAMQARRAPAWRSCRRASATSGPAPPTRSAWRAHRRRCCMPSRSCSCSCASRRSMRAGRCPSR